jgi:hypothetical protein
VRKPDRGHFRYRGVVGFAKLLCDAKSRFAVFFKKVKNPLREVKFAWAGSIIIGK